MSDLTQFDYLLNAFNAASQHEAPAAVGYADKRRALFDYVRALEARAPQPAPAAAQARKCLGMPDARCHYLADCGSVCNKCGNVHNPMTLKYGPEAHPPAPVVSEATEALRAIASDDPRLRMRYMAQHGIGGSINTIGALQVIARHALDAALAHAAQTGGRGDAGGGA